MSEDIIWIIDLKTKNIYTHKTVYMAFLKEDNSYSHVIAIDFGTGASG